jgi:hypothetical protein
MLYVDGVEESGGRMKAYRVQRCTMQRQLHNLDRRIVARLDGRVGRQRHLRQTHRTRIGVLAGADDLEGRHHRIAHVGRTTVWSVGAEAQVDIQERSRVALEPSRLEGDGAARCRPVCPVCGRVHPAARVHPLHAVGEGRVGDQVVAAPAWVDDDCVG